MSGCRQAWLPGLDYNLETMRAFLLAVVLLPAVAAADTGQSELEDLAIRAASTSLATRLKDLAPAEASVGLEALDTQQTELTQRWRETLEQTLIAAGIQIVDQQARVLQRIQAERDGADPPGDEGADASDETPEAVKAEPNPVQFLVAFRPISLKTTEGEGSSRNLVKTQTKFRGFAKIVEVESARILWAADLEGEAEHEAAVPADPEPVTRGRSARAEKRPIITALGASAVPAGSAPFVNSLGVELLALYPVDRYHLGARVAATGGSDSNGQRIGIAPELAYVVASSSRFRTSVGLHAGISILRYTPESIGAVGTPAAEQRYVAGTGGIGVLGEFRVFKRVGVAVSGSYDYGAQSLIRFDADLRREILDLHLVSVGVAISFAPEI